MQQRFLHWYVLNEIINICLLLFLFLSSRSNGLVDGLGDSLAFLVGHHGYWDSTSATASHAHTDGAYSGLARFSLALLLYVSCYVSAMVFMFCMLLVRRQLRPSKLRLDKQEDQMLDELPEFSTKRVTTRDGVQLRVYTTQTASTPPDTPVILLAEPLGSCGPNIFRPIMYKFGHSCVFVTWDYRGFFGSTFADTEDDRLRRLAISDHAHDAMEVLRSCSVDRAAVVIGYSMGTTVAQEFALLYPRQTGALVLLNGFHGQVFRTAFQPLCRIPGMSGAVNMLVEFLLHNRGSMMKLRGKLSPVVSRSLVVYAKLFGSPLLRRRLGDDYLLKFLEEYLGGICKTESNMISWLRSFQELDAHSVYHLLPSITQPVLIVSGFFDMLTPPMQSVEIARRIPQAVHYCDPWSSHASILESPEWTLAEIEEFVHANQLLTKSGSVGKTKPGKKGKRDSKIE